MGLACSTHRPRLTHYPIGRPFRVFASSPLSHWADNTTPVAEASPGSFTTSREIQLVTSLVVARDQFLAHCRHGRSLADNTVRAYSQDLNAFVSYVGDSAGICELTAQRVNGFVQYAQKMRAQSPSTVRRRVCCLKVFSSWLLASGQTGQNSLSTYRLQIKLPKRLPRTLTRAEVKALAANNASANGFPAAVGSTFDSDETTRLGILLMTSTGIRISELSSIRVGDIDTQAGVIRIHGKGSRERTVHVVNERLRVELESHLRRHSSPHPEARLLTNRYGNPITPAVFRDRLRKVVAAEGIKRRITPHMLRHTAATMLLELGVDVSYIQRLLGHQSIATTQIYIHVTDVSLRAALRRADVMAALEV